MRYENILEAVGNTPLVELKNINPNPKVKLYAKLEGFNPSGSLKDRIVKYMLVDAKEKGLLSKDKVLLEPTSGNTGISLAMFQGVFGYKFVAVMPENVSSERIEMIKGFGAEVILSEAEKGTNGAIELAKDILKREQGKYIMLNQYENYANVKAHYETTASEIIRDLDGQIDVFVAGLGTGGTITGVGKRLKEINRDIRIIAVQPYPNEGLVGLRNIWQGFVPPILDMSVVDISECVRDRYAFLTLRELSKKEGVFAGISSGAVLYTALKEIEKIKKGVVVILCADGGFRYLSEKILTANIETLSRKPHQVLW